MYKLQSRFHSGVPAFVPHQVNNSSLLAGKFAETGWANCGVCQSGTYSVSSQSFCSACLAGRFAATDNTAANPTPAGESCAECPAGTFSLSQSDSCTQCPAGEYSAAGQMSCDVCEVGKANANLGQASSPFSTMFAVSLSSFSANVSAVCSGVLRECHSTGRLPLV